MKKERIGSIISGVLSFIAGALSAVLGIVCANMWPGAFETAQTYGGDAYTGIQQAAAQTASNVKWLARIVKTGFSSVLIVVAIVLISVALAKLIPVFIEIAEENKAKKAQFNQAAINPFNQTYAQPAAQPYAQSAAQPYAQPYAQPAENVQEYSE